MRDPFGFGNQLINVDAHLIREILIAAWARPRSAVDQNSGEVRFGWVPYLVTAPVRTLAMASTV